jgi:drug/metabolite transporter (DMT)-like permease
MSLEPEDRRKALWFALSSAVVLAGADGVVKLLVAQYPLLMVAWMRFGVMAAIMGIYSWRQQGMRLFTPRAWKLQTARAVMAVVAIALFFNGLKRLPLPECVAISFVYPVLTSALARLWLGERPSALMWAGMGTSFIGVLFIVRPGSDVFTGAALYPLGSASALAVYLVITRLVAKFDDPKVTTFYGSLVAFLLFSLVVWTEWTPVSSHAHAALFLAVGALAAAGQFLVTLAYRHGPAQLVAPLGYLTVPAAVVVGWVMFGTLPGVWAAIGIAIIICAGAILATRAL